MALPPRYFDVEVALSSEVAGGASACNGFASASCSGIAPALFSFANGFGSIFSGGAGASVMFEGSGGSETSGGGGGGVAADGGGLDEGMFVAAMGPVGASALPHDAATSAAASANVSAQLLFMGRLPFSWSDDRCKRSVGRKLG
jgi:hypothetical protein